VAIESNNIENDFEFKKKLQVITIPKVAAYLLLITYALPATAGLGDRGH